jgi:hypothetical protein
MGGGVEPVLLRRVLLGHAGQRSAPRPLEPVPERGEDGERERKRKRKRKRKREQAVSHLKIKRKESLPIGRIVDCSFYHFL